MDEEAAPQPINLDDIAVDAITNAPAPQNLREEEEEENELPPTKRRRIGESESEEMMCCKKIVILRRYQSFFPEEAAACWGKEPLNVEMGLERLSDLEEQIQFMVCCKNGAKATAWAAEVGLQSIEAGLCLMTPIKAQGLSSLSKDKEFQSVVNEYCLQNSALFYTKPEYRIALHIAKTAMMLHHINTEIESGNFVRHVDHANGKQNTETIDDVCETLEKQ